MFFKCLYFFWVIWLFNIAPKHSAEVLRTVVKCKKAVVCLMEETGVLGQLRSGPSCSAVDQEFDIHQ